VPSAAANPLPRDTDFMNMSPRFYSICVGAADYSFDLDCPINGMRTRACGFKAS
jgi:hypothetical protein